MVDGQPFRILFLISAEHRKRAELERRLRVFANLPVKSLDRMSLQRQVDALGRDLHD